MVLLWILIYSSFKLEGDKSIFIVMLTVVLPILLHPISTEYFLNGQTLGKRAMNIRVVLLDGNQPSLGAYILRWLLILIDTEILTPLVAILTISVGGKGQRIGDVAAGTTVIKTTKRVSLSQVTYQALPDDYQITYSEVNQLKRCHRNYQNKYYCVEIPNLPKRQLLK
ncbi:MAG: RDD family protein [Spirosomataceae bacterium]